MSSEITSSRVPTAYSGREGNTGNDERQRVVNRPGGVRDPVHAWTLYVREPGELRWLPLKKMYWRDGKGRPVAAILTCTLPEQSDIGIVEKKVPNKATCTSSDVAEAPEERPMTEGNSAQDGCDLYAGTGGKH